MNDDKFQFAEPSYEAPKAEEIVLPEQPDETDRFDNESATAVEDDADFDAEEQNTKEDSA